MLQITERRLIEPEPLEIEEMRAAFSENDCLVLPGLIEPGLAHLIIEQVREAEFYSKTHTNYRQQEFSSDVTLRENNAGLHLLHFVLNNQNLFKIIKTITGCPKPITSFGGRIYCIEPSQGHHLEWHDDTGTSERQVGISINLSADCYEGGAFEIREKVSKQLRGRIKTETPGDAHIFRIAPRLEHRVNALESTAPRIAAAGWFVSETKYFDRIRQTSSKAPLVHSEGL